jgi:ATP-binding cassette subfamily B protein
MSTPPVGTPPVGTAPVGTPPAGGAPEIGGRPTRIEIPGEDEAWRGVAYEEVDDVTGAVSTALRARSRQLLRSLARPLAGRLSLAGGLVVIDTALSLSGPLLISGAIDRGIPGAERGSYRTLILFAALYVLVGLGSAGMRALFTRLSGRIGQAVLFDLRNRVFGHVQRLSVTFHESYTSGRVISRLTSDLDALSDLLEASLDGVFASLLSVVGILIVLLVLDVRLGLVVLASFVPLLILTRLYQRASQRVYREARTAVSKTIVAFVESMNGIRAVQAFRRERRNEDIFEVLNSSYRDANARGLTLIANFAATVRAVGNLTLAAVLGYGAYRITQHDLQIGVLTAFALYLRRFYDPLDDLANFFNAYQSASAALEKISGVLEEPLGVEPPISPVPLPENVRGDVRFTGVSFAYSSAPDRIVLPEMDLRLPAGQVVAVVGATGAGKTTLAKLLARFYDPTTGSVTVDEVDLRDVADPELRRAVTMVTQESFLFSGSVAENIAVGRPGATRAEIVGAAREVGADEFITALPDGYDTDVRKRGGRLSAGQRQLVSFARAFLADPAVLILDEATSSLDIPSERLVQRALETVLANRTALIIAHRLSTVLIADRVLVVDAGRVIEDGSPRELIAQHDGAFAGLYAAWEESLV